MLFSKNYNLMNKLNTSNSRDKSRVFSNPSIAHNVTRNPQYQLVLGNMKASTSRKKHSVAHIVTTNPQHQLVWRSMKQFISPQLLFEGGLTVKLLLIPWMHQSSLPRWMQLCQIKAFVKETKMSNLSVKKIWSMEYSKNLIITRRESKMKDGLKIYLIKSKIGQNYTTPIYPAFSIPSISLNNAKIQNSRKIQHSRKICVNHFYQPLAAWS